LAAIATSRLYSPSHIVVFDVADSRLEAALKFGADTVVNTTGQNPREMIEQLTGGLGADVAMEAVGLPETFEQVVELVRPGGHVANIGVHGRPATLHLEQIWIKNLTITTGLVDTHSTPTLIDLMANHQLDITEMITHRFTMDEFDTAYDVFATPAETGALKVLVTPSA
jgi:alcohol dehydrogenase